MLNFKVFVPHYFLRDSEVLEKTLREFAGTLITIVIDICTYPEPE